MEKPIQVRAYRSIYPTLLQRLIIAVATSKLVIWVCQEAVKAAEEIKVQIHMATLVHMVKVEDLVWQGEQVPVGTLPVPQGDGDPSRCPIFKLWVFPPEVDSPEVIQWNVKMH